MSTTLVTHTHPQRSDEWYSARAGLITASVLPHLVKPSTLMPASNDTSRRVIARLAAERVTGHPEQTYPTWQMQRGIDDEPVAAELYARRHGVTVTDSGLMVRTWDHGLEIGASPDGLIGDDGLIEIKSRGQATQLEHIARGVVPPDARIQIQAQLLVSGRDWCDYVSYCPLMPLWVVRITRDQDTIDCLFAAAETAEEQIRDLLASYDDRSPGDPVPARVEDAYI